MCLPAAASLGPVPTGPPAPLLGHSAPSRANSSLRGLCLQTTSPLGVPLLLSECSVPGAEPGQERQDRSTQPPCQGREGKEQGSSPGAGRSTLVAGSEALGLSSARPEVPPGTLLLLTATGGDAGSSQSTCPARWEERTPAAPLERGGCFCCLQGCGQHAVAHYWCCWPSGDPKCQSSRVSLTDGAWTRHFCSRSLFPPVKWG